MDKAKITQFIKQLSKDTLSGKLSWRRLTDYNNLDYSSNKSISGMLFQNEFHHIDFFASYYCPAGKGTVFVLNEINESGRDGTITSGYKIYLHDDTNDRISNLPCYAGTEYQLVNSIHSQLTKDEAAIESFIDNYLSQS